MPLKNPKDAPSYRGIEAEAYDALLDDHPSERASTTDVEIEMLARDRSAGVVTVRGVVSLAVVPRMGELVELKPGLVVQINQVLHARGARSKLWASVASGEPPSVDDLASLVRLQR